MRSRANIAVLGRCETAPCDEDFTDALLSGLRRTPKSIPCKFFYDAAGSLLFEEICTLPEYYPTRVELSLLRTHAREMAAEIGPGAEIVEFGAGAGEKIRPLLDALENPRAYLPMDISGPYLKTIAAGLQARYPLLAIQPIVGDFAQHFSLPPSSGGRRIGFFPGSTIGNFEPDEAREFLVHVAEMLRGGGLLVGVDLVKDPQILHAAYNDSAGVTAAFNKNLLARANREAGANFDLDQFDHYGFYNPLLHRVEIYLVSRKAQRVKICGRSFAFAEGEAIHTEYSHKYTVEDFRALAQSAGFIPRSVWTDDDRLFSIHWLEAK
jgi:dimethylhistidine N-methyltransferase